MEFSNYWDRFSIHQIIPFLVSLLFGVFSISSYWWCAPEDPILFIEPWRKSPLAPAFLYLTMLGESPPYIFVILYFAIRKDKLAYWISGIGLAVMVVSNSLKLIFAQGRPYFYLVEKGLIDQVTALERMNVGHNSFPSGHTLSAFALFTFLILLNRRHPGLNYFFVICSVLTGVSRVFLGHHFLTDVGAGAILGMALAVIFVNWMGNLIKKSGRIDSFF